MSSHAFRTVATLVFLAVPTLTLTAEPASQVLPLIDSLDFGQVAPQTPAQPVLLSFLVFSDKAWRVTLESGTSASNMRARELEILTPSDGWVPLEPALPRDLAAGGPTGAAGASVVVSVRPVVNFDAPIGVRRGNLRLAVSDGLTLDVPVHYEVLPSAVFREITQEPIFAINPVARGLYPVERRTLHVTSNTSWNAEITQLSPLTLRGNALALQNSVLNITATNADPIPLVMNTPVSIRHGEATGEAGVVVQFQLALTIEGGELGGEYEAGVRIDVSPLAEAPAP